MVKKIVDIQVIDAEKRRSPSKHYTNMSKLAPHVSNRKVYVILVTWSDGSRIKVYRRYSRFFDLQTRLLDHFPIEAGTVDPEKRVIPFLPGKIFFGRSQIKDVAMKRLKEINEYCQSLIKLPPHISECDDVLDFFEVEPDDLDPPTENNDKGNQKNSQEIKAEKISRPKRFDCYVAMAEYSPQAPGELYLKPGMKVEVLEKSDSGWWFVNSHDEQGWVPSTYLEREGGSDPHEKQGPVARPGQEENYICIEKFEADSADEISLERGTVVQVLQKNLDGWWLIRYRGREAYAPGTYLQKTSNMNIASVVEKSQLSGVEVISSLHDVSNLLGQHESKTSIEPAKTVTQPENKAAPKVSSNFTKSSAAMAFVKQRSLERGGSLNPPPRQNSVRKMDILPSVNMSTVYVTIEDFTDTVGDGLSFKRGEQVVVSEKTSTGWWFVKIGENEGWVPANYLEPYSEQTVDDNNYYEDDEDWYVEPEDVCDFSNDAAPDNPAKRPLPAIPPDESLTLKQTAKPGQPSQLNKISAVTSKTATSSSRISASESSGKEIPICAPKVAGSQDFASLLKAKFEARAKSSGNSESSSDEDSPKGPNISHLQSMQKPSVSNTKINKNDGLRGIQEGTSRKFSDSVNSKIASKPPPPAKAKPSKPDTLSKPSVVLSGSQVSKPAKLPIPSKPLSKPTVDNENKGNDKIGVKNAGLGNMKPELVKKPQVSIKPKMAVSSNVVTIGKSTSADQNVNSLAKSLSGKLHFDQHSSVIKSPSSEGLKSPSSLSGSMPKSLASPVENNKSHIALFTFVAENDGELGFSEGSEVEVIDQQGDWSLVRVLHKEGWAPSNYLQKL